MKARLVRSSSPKPARLATSTPPPSCGLSSRSRTISTRSAAALAGVMLAKVTGSGLSPIGRWIGRKPFNQLDDLKALRWRKSEESLQQAKTFDR